MSDQFAEQIKKLDALRHAADSSALEEFDEETEQLILQRFGEATNHLEAYELAIMGEAETIVNMPQSAQEDATQDLFHMSIEQRRQVLEGCLADLAEATARPVVQRSAPPPAPKAAPKATKKPRVAKKKKKAAKKKAGTAKKAAKKSGKKTSAKKKKPARSPSREGHGR
ncbi:MAG: hypothetical protein D4R81_06920 [Nitrospiraceae bacterium]|nr:MAG: hypothetical protein D4R81_06920 [Nitrospiraceae bacterium]